MARAVPVILDPYDGKTGLLVPFVLERIRAMVGEGESEVAPRQVMVNIASRLYNRDLSLKVAAFLDERGKLVGHVVAMIETDGQNHWLFIQQMKMDPGEWGDVVDRAMDLADRWAQEFSEQALIPRGYPPIRLLLMATHRDDRAWQRRHGFKTWRRVMAREIGATAPDKGE